jgi:iron(III) transport system substrate-binding protein
MTPRITKIFLIASILFAGFLTWRLFAIQPTGVVVLYCAHDMQLADPVIRAFSEATGIRVLVQFDTEATKSLGLVERLKQEQGDARADVFWNNEQLGTMDLAEAGVLDVYQGPGWNRIPERYRDPAGRWAGFAARLRVELEREGCQGRKPGEGAIAKPLYGTTLTHYSALWARHGGEAVKRWHAESRQAGLAEVDGNGAVKRVVAEGAKQWGLTDTDDAFEALAGKAPVRMQPARVRFLPALAGVADDAKAPTIAIPNTAALVKGCKHPEEARKLLDFLLSAEVELLLANGSARQVPLGPVDETRLPEPVRALRPAVAEGLPLAEVFAARAPCLAWLKEEYAGK